MILGLTATCEGKEHTKSSESVRIVRMTGQYTICGDNKISDEKISFILTITQHNQTRQNLWEHETLRLTKTQFVGTKNTAITKSLPFSLFTR